MQNKKRLKTYSVYFEGDVLVDAKNEQDAINEAWKALGTKHGRDEFMDHLRVQEDGVSEPANADEHGSVYFERDTYHGGPGYAVVFEDDNGRSILARTRTEYGAEKLQAMFEKRYERGHLLRPYASAYSN